MTTDKKQWRFIPSHDVPTEFGMKAVPDMWVDPDGNTHFDDPETKEAMWQWIAHDKHTDENERT